MLVDPIASNIWRVVFLWSMPDDNVPVGHGYRESAWRVVAETAAAAAEQVRRYFADGQENYADQGHGAVHVVFSEVVHVVFLGTVNLTEKREPARGEPTPVPGTGGAAKGAPPVATVPR